MIEKVNPSHPDKLADRIAGAIVDLAYKRQERPKVATEVLLGHDHVFVIIESSVLFTYEDIEKITNRILGQETLLQVITRSQDPHLAENQKGLMKCGDNGIFKGMPVTEEQQRLTEIARAIYDNIPTDGKYILNGNELIVCQSHIKSEALRQTLENVLGPKGYTIKVNPLGDWTGGPAVDAGATNRKLGSDMGDGVTGGGLHGKDLSKADVSVNIYAHLKAQATGKPVEMYCAIGDNKVNGIPFREIVDIAREYIQQIGGFEKFAEWGLI